LLRQAPRWGAKLFHKAKIEAPIAGLSLRVNGETRAFDAIIVTAGAWGAQLLPEFAGRLAVKRRVVGWFETEQPRLLPIVCVDNEVGVFGMPAPRGLYKVGLHAVGGSTEPDQVREPDAADAAQLSAHAAPLLPKHNPQPVRMQRCLYTVTPDENFLIKRSSAHERVLMFSACSGHGFKYAPIFGELAQEWLTGAPSRELDALMKPGSNVNRLGAPKT
jgi:sarcosine oxidase